MLAKTDRFDRPSGDLGMLLPDFLKSSDKSRDAKEEQEEQQREVARASDEIAVAMRSLAAMTWSAVLYPPSLPLL
jgi:hypothetical protein